LLESGIGYLGICMQPARHTQKERKPLYVDKEEPSRVEEDFGRIYRNLESRCVCFGECVNNGDHVGEVAGRIRERGRVYKAERDWGGGCGGGEKKFP
jgi:hypothetical protein